jgi:hypothetical protein
MVLRIGDGIENEVHDRFMSIELAKPLTYIARELFLVEFTENISVYTRKIVEVQPPKDAIQGSI